MIKDEDFILSNGVKIPKIGFGILVCGVSI